MNIAAYKEMRGSSIGYAHQIFPVVAINGKNKIGIFFLKFMFGGVFYFNMEVVYRGFSHFSMFLAGGLVFCFLCKMSKHSYSVPMCGLIGGVFITCVELIIGCVVNLWLGMHVWDYSNMFMNFQGQICLLYFSIWCAVSLGVVYFVRAAPSATQLAQLRIYSIST